MKARLVPVYFEDERDDEFDRVFGNLKELLKDEAEFLEPVELGSRVPDADGVIFPKLVGKAFKEVQKFRKFKMPIIIATSEFGTVNMWDWEIVSFLKSQGIKPFTPYNVELTRIICRSLALKRIMPEQKFLVFQDNPGEGMQASIFKRFYWWEDACTNLIKEKFGITVEKRSFKKLGEAAKSISDDEAKDKLNSISIKTEGLDERALLSAIKIYLAITKEIEGDDSIAGIGINCLNESFYSDTTPCLAWNLLYEEKGLMWACEADTMSLLTKYLIHKTTQAPIMMSNIYPFLMGMAALKHEKIDKFPDVEEPENHMLVAHCGYLGIVPVSFSSSWVLRPRVLEIVNPNAIAIDARLPEGPLTLAKLHPGMEKIQVVEGELEGYVQYPGSDCRNGAVIRVQNGYRIMKSFYSHHNLLITGHRKEEIGIMAEAFDLEVEEV